MSQKKAVVRNAPSGESIDDLKRSGDYEGLENAFRKASGMSLNEPDTANLLPTGSYEELGLTASDGAAGARFGFSVALSGNTAVIGAFQDDVGANTDQGSAYVFIRDGSTWTQQAKLTAADGAANDWFGYNVTISGETAVIGAVYDDIGANTNQGSSYVFTRSGTTWTQQQKLTASDGNANDYLGYSLSVKGDTLVAGAYPHQSFKGAAYIYTRTAGVWTQDQKLSASDGVANDHFGYSVQLDSTGSTMVIGAVWDTIGSNVKQGSAYIFTKSGATWSEQQKLTASDGATEDWLGFRVAISGDSVIVSAFLDDVTAGDQGSAYIFTRSGTTWTQQAKLVTSDAAASDQLGAVGIYGDTAVIGSSGSNIGSNADQGAIYLFKRTGSAWAQESKLTSDGGSASDSLGGAVAIDGDTVIAGSSADDIGANADQGSGKIFQTKTWSVKQGASDLGSFESFGNSVSISGDTAVVGATGANTNTGAAYVFVRSGATWVLQQKLTAADAAEFDLFGQSVAISGDTVIVGANCAQVGSFPLQGAVYVFTRSGTTWTQEAKLTAADGATEDRFGSSVALSGDTAVVGAYAASTSRGSAYVFTRSGTTWSQQQKLTASDAALNDEFGGSVSVSGDTAVISSPGSSSSRGATYVFVRSGASWTQQQKLTATDGVSMDGFGHSVSVSGDTTVISAIGANTYRGAAYVFTRSGAVWTQQQKLAEPEAGEYFMFGKSVSLSGDSILVGSISSNNTRGAAYLFRRSGDVWSIQRQLIASDGVANDYYGWSVGVSTNTAIIGALFASYVPDGPDVVQGAVNQGATYMYYWGPTPTTASGSSLSGRVLDTNGRGLVNATVVLMDTMGVERVVQTGSFGRFRFNDLPSGEITSSR